MKTLQLIFVLLLLSLSVFIKFPSNVYSVPPHPSVTETRCKIIGIIENVDFEKAHFAPCMENQNCPSDFPTEFPDRYNISITIESTHAIAGRPDLCINNFPTKKIKTVQLGTSNLKGNTPPVKGQRIEATTSFWFSDTNIEEYSLSNQGLNIPLSIKNNLYNLFAFFLKFLPH
jgi:hypothetical protein